MSYGFHSCSRSLSLSVCLFFHVEPYLCSPPCLCFSCLLCDSVLSLVSYFCLQFGMLMPGITQHFNNSISLGFIDRLSLQLKIGFLRFAVVVVCCVSVVCAALVMQPDWPQSSQVDHILIWTRSAHLHCQDADMKEDLLSETPLCK